MDVTVSTTDLAKELALTEKLVTRKPTIPVLGCALLEATAAGLRVSGTDLEVGVRGSVAARVLRDGAAAVPMRRLYDLVRLLPDIDLRIEADAGNAVLTSPSGFRGRLSTLDVADYPVLPELPVAQAQLPGAALRQVLAAVRFACTADDQRYFLAGVLFAVADGRMRAVATDAHRLAHASAACPAATIPSAIVPRRTVDVLLPMAETAQRVGYAVTESHLFFTADDHMLFSRRPAGEFPKWERIVPKPAPHRLELVREPLVAVLQRAKLAADANSHRVAFALAKAGLTVSASSPDGETSEHVAGLYGGEELAMAFNADYVLDFLGVTEDERVTFEAAAAETPAVWRPVGGEVEYEYVVMPMRI